jgi:hypothetical protein
MAIAKVGTDTSGTSTTLSNSFSHTLVSGTDRLIVVSILAENSDTYSISTVTYGGVAMTQAVDLTGGFNYATLYYLLEVSLPLDGSNTVSITFTGTSNDPIQFGFCSEYTGVEQTTPEATDTTYQTSGATITNDISPSTEAWVISAMVAGNSGCSFTHGQSQVELYDSDAGGVGGGSSAAVAELRSASGETALTSTLTGTLNRLLRIAVSFTAASSPFDPMNPVTIYQINCGGGAVSPYITDTFFSGGTTASTGTAVNTSGVSNPPPQTVCQAERYGNVTYTITGLTANKKYFLRLHYSENYWTGAGQRVFNVSIQGTTVLSNFDIYVAAGNANFTLIVREYYVVANSSGNIVIVQTTVTDNAVIEAIEVYTAITNIWVNVSGQWKAVSDVYTNVSGTWELINTNNVNVSGTWQQVGE